MNTPVDVGMPEDGAKGPQRGSEGGTAATRVVVLGGDGMLGHQLLKSLRREYDTRVTLHQALPYYRHYGLFDEANSFAGIAVTDSDRLMDVMSQFRPNVIINAVGMIKQRSEAKNPLASLEVNSVFPHRLATLASLLGARLIHFSTDCVFSGRRGHYSEHDIPDAEDLYGRSKLLGEVAAPNCLTLRTSIIGRELDRKRGLLEWFLAQRGSVKGYRRAVYTGFTTLELSRIVSMLIGRYPSAEGLWHVSSERISKFALLQLIRQHYRLDIEVMPDDEFVCDRSLDSSRFRAQCRYTPPTWEAMIAELSR